MTLLGYALQAIGRGFHVFPVEPGGKTPGRLYPNRPAEEAPWTYRWSEVATIRASTIINWWNACPTYNIGIACKPSGLLVVDCDEGPGKNGLDQWTYTVERYGNKAAVWNTYTVITGGGGAHLYYKWPREVQASQSGIASNVDIRSNGGDKGGYVLGPGSITEKGAYFTDHDPGFIAGAPLWLVELCRDVPRPKCVKSGVQQPDSLAFGGLVASVATAVDGDRNNCLHWAARAMCSDGASESTALELLVPAAVESGLTERGATDTIHSGYNGQRRKDGR